jgi:glucose-1-phosphate adenylyltransferase
LVAVWAHQTRAWIKAGARVGDGDDNAANKLSPQVLNTGLTLVGEGSSIPEGMVLGRNVVVHPLSDEKAFGPHKKIASGSDVGVSLR